MVPKSIFLCLTQVGKKISDQGLPVRDPGHNSTPAQPMEFLNVLNLRRIFHVAAQRDVNLTEFDAFYISQ